MPSSLASKRATEFDFCTTQHGLFLIDFETSVMKFLKKLAAVSFFFFIQRSRKHHKIVDVPLYIVKVSSQPVHQALHALRTVGQTQAETSVLKSTPRCAQNSFFIFSGRKRNLVKPRLEIES